MQLPVIVQAYIINAALVVIAVLIHYEILRLLSILIPRSSMQHRFKVVTGLLGALVAHIIEIWMFGLGYFVLVHMQEFGGLAGNYTHTVLDSVYYSFVAYTSLGLGDVYPTGYLRFLTGLETLTGLVLITWTASFMFIEMQKFWDDR